MKMIDLEHGKSAIVDDGDYENLIAYRWYFDRGYAKRNGKMKNNHRSAKVYMHREIMHTPDGMDTDHINGNKLDNRRENLRICTRSQNKANGKAHIDNPIKLKGVCWDKARNKWSARICVNYIQHYLGRFTSLPDAVKAYDNAARKYFAEFAKTNIEKE